jgi:hypothetical protein
MPEDKDILDPELDGDDELKPVAPIAEEDNHDSLDALADEELGDDEDDEDVVEPAFSDDE